VIEHRVGDIFEQKDLTHIAHQANLFHTFGSGIAKEIKERYLRAYEADKRTIYGDRLKLGQYSQSSHPERRGEPNFPTIVNIYSQDGIGGQDRQTNYAALGSALLQLERELQGLYAMSGGKVKLGIPHRIGCGLANGDWKVVRAVIESAFGASPVPVIICKKDALACDDCGKFAGWLQCLVCTAIFCRCKEAEHAHMEEK
jgi:O-acetyl-ADP-ribose deacetylase (regulator of RNase III)